MEKKKWLDLSAYGARAVVLRPLQKRGFYLISGIDPSSQEFKAILDIKKDDGTSFFKVKDEKFLYCHANFVPLSKIKDALPLSKVTEEEPKNIFYDKDPSDAGQFKSMEEFSEANLSSAIPVGTNYHGDMVLLTKFARAVRRVDKQGNKHIIYEDQVNDPAAFFRKPADPAYHAQFTQQVAMGFVRSMKDGEKLRTAHLVSVLSAIKARAVTPAELEYDPEALELLLAIQLEGAKEAMGKAPKSKAEADQVFEKARAMHELSPELFVEGVVNRIRRQEAIPAPLIAAIADAIPPSAEHNTVVYSPTTPAFSLVSKNSGGTVVFAGQAGNSTAKAVRELLGKGKILEERGLKTQFSEGSEVDLVFAETQFSFLGKKTVSEGDFSTNRGDFLYALKAVQDKKPDGIAVITMQNPDERVSFVMRSPGAIENSTIGDLIAHIGKTHEILSVANLHKERVAKRGDTYGCCVLVVGRKLDEPRQSFNPKENIAVYRKETLRSWEEVQDWSSDLKSYVSSNRLLEKKAKPLTTEEIEQARLAKEAAEVSQRENAEKRRLAREARKAEKKAAELGEATLDAPLEEVQDAPIQSEVVSDAVDSEMQTGDIEFAEDDDEDDVTQENIDVRTIDPFKDRRLAAIQESKDVPFDKLFQDFNLSNEHQALLASLNFSPEYSFVTEQDGNLLDKGAALKRAESSYQAPATILTKLKEPSKMVPRNMVSPMTYAADQLAKKVGDIDIFLSTKLSLTESEISEFFNGEQIQQIAASIVRVESNRGFIIGSQTGTGKGRVLAAMARYAILRKMPVMFLTEGSHLFSDFYRDLRAIKSDHLFKEFLIMNNDKKANICDDIDGRLLVKRDNAKVEQILALHDQNPEGENASLKSNGIDIAFATYSQFRNKDSLKSDWIAQQATKDALLILDESHNAAGNSNTGYVIRKALENATAAVHSSATYSKTPETMGTYSTVFPQGMSIEQIQETLKEGGEPMAEIVSSMLARDGGFLRYEHDFSKLKIVNKIDEAHLERNADLSDAFSDILREINRVNGNLEKMSQNVTNRYNREMAMLPEHIRRGGNGTNLESTGFGSTMSALQRIFALVLKADFVADLAIEALQNGQKPVIVLEQTQESVLVASMKGYLNAKEAGDLPEEDIFEDIIFDEEGNELPPLEDGQIDLQRGLRMPAVTIKNVLFKAFKRATSVKRKNADGTTTTLSLTELAIENARVTPQELQEITDWEERVMAMIYDLPDLEMTPIDYVRQKIEAAGYTTGEVTGRKYQCDLEEGLNGAKNMVVKRRADTRQEDVRGFNRGDIDSLVINIAGASGISVHANAEFANHNQRVLIEWQVAQDVNKRIQLFGRINREGQVNSPEVWTVGTGLPFEMRHNSMQLAKLRTHSAHTQGNRRNVVEEGAKLDLMNKVGDESASEYLMNHPEIVELLAIDMDALTRSTNPIARINKLSFLMSLLYVNEQMEVFEELEADFKARLRDMEMQGESPLSAKEFDWKAKTVREALFLGEEREEYESAFDMPVFLRTVEFDEYKTPIRWSQIQEAVKENQATWARNFNDEEFRETRAYDISNRFEERFQQMMRSNLSPRFFNQDEDPADITAQDAAIDRLNNSRSLSPVINNLNSRKNLCRETLPHLYPGALVRMSYDLAGRNYVILDVTFPPEGSEHQMNRTIIKFVAVGDQRPSTMSLSMLYSGGYKIEPIEKIVEDPEVSNQQAFDRVPSGRQRESRVVLAGNLFRAMSEVNGVNTGTVGVYTDENGVRQNAIVMRKGVDEHHLNLMPYTTDPDSARAILRVLPHAEVSFYVGKAEERLSIRNLYYSQGRQEGQEHARQQASVWFVNSQKKENWSNNEGLMSLLRKDGRRLGGSPKERLAIVQINEINAIIKEISKVAGKAVISFASRSEIGLHSDLIEEAKHQIAEEDAERERLQRVEAAQAREHAHLRVVELEQPADEVDGENPPAEVQNLDNEAQPPIKKKGGGPADTMKVA